MAEIDFYLADDEENDFVRFCFSSRLWLIPDLNYDQPKTVRIDSVDEFARLRTHIGQFFIVGDAYVKWPLSLRQIERQGKTVFFIYPRDGGPVLCFLRSGVFHGDGGRSIRPGCLSYYPWYESPTGQHEKPPLQLTSTYKKLAGWVRAHAVQIKPAVRTYWLGHGARNLARSGHNLIGLEQFQSRLFQ